MEYKPYFTLKINTSGLDESDRVSEISLIYEDLSYLEGMNSPSISLRLDNGDKLNKQSLKWSPHLSSQEALDADVAGQKIHDFLEGHDPGRKAPIVSIDITQFAHKFLIKSDLDRALGRRVLIDLKSIFFVNNGYLPTKKNLFKNFKSFDIDERLNAGELPTALDECFLINSVFWKMLSQRLGM